ncbi:MAG: hypothetical protein ACLRMN_07555 [Mediterraneibacter gnavus]
MRIKGMRLMWKIPGSISWPFSQDTEFEVYEVNVTEEDVKAVIEEEVN